MSLFSHIIFDLDGTLTDNTRGISNSLKYALRKMHIDDYPEEILKQFIGPPLQWGFKTLFGMNERNTQLAVEYFREYFGEKGLFENEPYPGIREMMEELYFAGKKMYIATSKLEKYALRICEHFEFDKYIVRLKGADYSGEKATKPEMISDLLRMERISASKNVVVVGDTVFDMEGGRENGLSTVAVTYGFGRPKELYETNPDFIAGTVEELFQILSS